MSRATVNDSFWRYNFPRSRKAQTTFGLSGVDLARGTAHEFIIGFNYEFMTTFKCNHDIQFLMGGKDAADRIHYCTKYVTKQQKRLDTMVVMALAAFRRRQERETLDASFDMSSSTDFLSTTRKRVASMAYTMTSRQEIAGPLAALYLYRGSCCFESSGCAFLPLRDSVHQLCSTEEFTCQLVDGNDVPGTPRYLAVSFLDDYLYRPESLSSVNIYEFTMRYFRKRDDHPQTSLLQFKISHPLCKTHSLGKRYQEVVSVVQGFRLPFTNEHSPDEIRYKHAILSLVLLKPFRKLGDLIGSSVSSGEQWIQSFDEWQPTRSDFVKMIMNHIDDYHSGVDQANTQADRMATDGSCAVAEENEMDDSSSEHDSLFSVEGFDGVEDADECSDCDDRGAFINPWLEGGMASDVVLDSQALHPAACPTAATSDSRILKMLNVFKNYNMLEGGAESAIAHQQNVVGPDSFPAINDMQKWVQNAATDCNLGEPASTHEDRACDTSIVEILADALEEDALAWNSPHAPVSRGTVEYNTIADISRDFKLNEKQHYAFKRIGRAQLSRWRNVEDLTYLNSNESEVIERDQLRMFFWGEGGTGKSRIIDAVQALCRSWQRPDCIVKTALTGKAATVIGGRTLASLLVQLPKKWSVSSAICVDILAIDEVSKMRKTQLAQQDKLLRVAKRVADVAFGGVHVILVGDFLQLPPVGGGPLFKDPATTRRHQTANELAGYHLWLSFTDVILFEESVRFRADSEWGRGCRLARQGVWLPEFVDIINSRVIGNAQAALDDWRPGNTVPVFITPDNATRLSINNLFISTAAKLLPKGEYPIRVAANFKGKLAKLGSSEVRMIMALPDSKFGRMVTYLDLVVGMPIHLTQNVRAKTMAANGTHGTVESIILNPGTTFRVVRDSVANVTVKIPNIPPPAVVVRIARGHSATSMQGCDNSDLFPLFSNARPYNQCDIKLAPSSSGTPRSLSVRIEQFPNGMLSSINRL